MGRTNKPRKNTHRVEPKDIRVRRADGLLTGSVDGKRVVLAWEPADLGASRRERLPLGEGGPEEPWPHALIIASERWLGVIEGCVSLECAACHEAFPLHEVGLRRMDAHHLRNQPRCGDCRHNARSRRPAQRAA